MTADAERFALAPEKLGWRCDLQALDFSTTDDLEPGKSIPGQRRAVDAMKFGVSVPREGYNIFLLGPAGSHRHDLALQFVGEHARGASSPSDWCYVNNFDDPQAPVALRFPTGVGVRFRDDISGLIEELRVAIPAAYESDEYRNQINAIKEETKHQLEAGWKAFEEAAQRENIGVMQTSRGYVLAPLQDGKVINDEDFEKLPDPEREEIGGRIERLSSALQANIERMPKLQKALRERVRELDRDVMTANVGLLIGELKDKYAEYPNALRYLDQVQLDCVDNAQDFRHHDTPELPFLGRDHGPSYSRYEVNLLVGSAFTDGAPVVYEPNPSYGNVIGKIEHKSELGALLTDFRMIRAGALHRANGGYLVLDIARVLSRPFAWEAIKQALFARSVRIETPGETYGLIGTATLRPQPIPLDVKIILIGERWLYYLLARFDSEFDELFKVPADLDDDEVRTGESEAAFARMIAHMARTEDLRPFARSAVERVLEQASRNIDDQERLSAHARTLQDLLRQADYWAGQRGVDVVARMDVDRAIDAQKERTNRVPLKVQDAIERDILLIDTSRSVVGQVNGLAIVAVGSFSFGHPVRITASTRIGSGEVIDIQREAKLGGAIHSKAVMTLAAALSARYAPGTPLSMLGTLVFEQSYGIVEGDSASVAELCVLISSLSGIPIQQSLAVTGSVNQLGRVQVIGGINEKIEGFFEVCRRRGLDGAHGVIIPRENVKHLMLHDDVIDAVRDGKFRIYGVQNIDEAVTALTGVEAGERGNDGEFPEGSVNYRVEQTLLGYARSRSAFGKKDTEGDD